MMMKQWPQMTIAVVLAMSLVLPVAAEPQQISNPFETWFNWLGEMWAGVVSGDEMGGGTDPLGRDDEAGGLIDPFGSPTSTDEAGGLMDPFGDEATGYIQPNGEPAAATGHVHPIGGDELYPTIEPAG